MNIFSKKGKDLAFEEPENDNLLKGAKRITPTHRLTPEEVVAPPQSSPAQKYDGKSALESLKARMQKSFEGLEEEKAAVAPTVKAETQKPVAEAPVKEESPVKEEAPVVIKPQKTLLEKCKPYITDDSGRDLSNAIPLYKLESVADILEGNSKNTLNRLAKQYDITVEDLTRAKREPIEKKPIKKEPPKSPTPTQDKEIIEINAFFENVQSSVPFSVSEVESQVTPEPAQTNLSDTATITFTPVSDNQSAKPKIMVTSNTQSIDLTGEITAIQDVRSFSKNEPITLEKNEFEDFTPETEIKTEKDIKTYIRNFSIKKRRSFLTVSLSVILTLVLAFMKLPFMTSVILGETKIAMIICTAIAALAVIINGDMFLALPKMFGKKSVADSSPALASLLVLGYAILGILSGEIVLDMLILLGIILSIRAFGKFRKDSYMLSNLKQIATSSSKNALKLIDDTAVTFAIAKNSIEGDTLIAAPQKCNNISDYLKYSTFGSFLNGKMPVITIVSILFAIISAFAASSYYDGAVYGLYAAASVLCFASIPPLFFIKDFPLYAAAKRLNKNGAMIAGQMGANHIEMSNAVLLNAADIFPTGTVTLHQMKILSDNNLDQTILRAASLTKSLNSPLAPIFEKIAGESNITTLPDSDTIKYEERMGISGWVDNKPLFIGNRTLMEAHGIAVPDIELDRKILRSGYFPIYLASDEKPCALFMVQYSVDPDVAYELRRLTKIGVTLIVNNTDPNVSAEMICDYLGLYSDSVMIMSNAGYHMFKNAVTPQESCSAPASFRGENIMIAKIVNCANKIKRSNTLLSVLYILSAILGIVIFTYSSFAGSGTLINSATVLLYSLISTAASYILYLFLKP